MFVNFPLRSYKEVHLNWSAPKRTQSNDPIGIHLVVGESKGTPKTKLIYGEPEETPKTNRSSMNPKNTLKTIEL